MAWGVDEVELVALPIGGGVVHAHRLGFDCYAALPFQGIGVHDQLANLLMGAEDLALFQQSIDQGGFAIVDVCDYGQISIFIVMDITQINLPYPPW